jgi:hypothetical protein
VARSGLIDVATVAIVQWDTLNSVDSFWWDTPIAFCTEKTKCSVAFFNQ